MNKKTVVLLPLQSYLLGIESSIGSKTYQRYYALVDEEMVEILDCGDKSCAFFVSSFIASWNLLPRPDVTVNRVLQLMVNCGWFPIQQPQPGCVTVYKEKFYGEGNPRMHIGLYIGNDIAVSNNDKERVPIQHRYDEYNGRGLDSMWSHPALQSEETFREHLGLS